MLLQFLAQLLPTSSVLWPFFVVFSDPVRCDGQTLRRLAPWFCTS